MAWGEGATMSIRKYDIFNVIQQQFPLLLCLLLQVLTLFILYELLVEDIRVKLQQRQQVCFICTIQFNDCLLMSFLETLTVLFVSLYDCRIPSRPTDGLAERTERA